MPVTTLNAVVLPAPFGPISPRISPRSMWKLTPLRAVTPPNLSVTSSSESRVSPVVTGVGCWTVSATAAPLIGRCCVVGRRTARGDDGVLRLLADLQRLGLRLHPLRADGAARRQQTLRPVDRQQHEREPEHEHPPLLEPAEPLRQVGDHDGADDGAPAVALAADDDRREEQDRDQQRERLGVDERLPGGEQRARDAADERADREREQLEPER